MERTELIERILDYFKEEEDEFVEVIEELDSYCGILGDDRYYDMEELDEICGSQNVDWILNRAYFGYDDDCSRENENGETEYAAFCPNRNYFYFNGYGNFVSADYKDYSAHLDEYFVEELLEHWQRLSLPYGVQSLIEEYEEDEDDE